LAWVILQGAFGALTVTWKLYPAVVTGHLLGGMGLLALLALQTPTRAASAAGLAGRGSGATASLSAWPRLALTAQLALGAWVSTNYAVLACPGFPQCNGRWWPAMNWSEGFTLLRELGRRADGQWISMSALVAIQWTHRLFAIVVVVCDGVARRAAVARGPDARRRGLLIAGLVVLQLATGCPTSCWAGRCRGAGAHCRGGGAGRLPRARGRHRDAIPLPILPDMSSVSVPTPLPPSRWRQFYALTKPRVVQLIVFCAVIGMFLAVPGWPPLVPALAATAGIWLVAAAAAAFNCIVEQQIDRRMTRTAWRPTAKGELTNTQTLVFAASSARWARRCWSSGSTR
jgi:heme A synthase